MHQPRPLGLLSALDMVVMERTRDGSFRLVAPVADWLRELRPTLTVTGKAFKPEEHFLFLGAFLDAAVEFWSRQAPGHLDSGIWCEMGPSAEEYHLAASAVCAEGGTEWLVIHRLGSSYDEKQAVLQKARELRLAYDRLAQAETKLTLAYGQLERGRNDLLSILNQLRLGVVLTDDDGCLSFMNCTAEKLFGVSSAEAQGKRMEQLVCLRSDDGVRLDAMPEPEGGARVPVQVDAPGGTRSWMEVDVREDPQDPNRKIYFFYDLTEIYDLRRLLADKARFHDLVGKSKQMMLLFQLIQEVAKVDSTVLIGGETGTGKELVARAIHDCSRRRDKPFVAINCAGLTESLIASQLFGHKKGAFTGAVTDQLGLFEAASGGTLFLDEIGDIPLSIQTSLLRVLQEREIVRLGETKPRKIDVRILAAAQRDLREAVAQGRFRADLLYRIQVARVRLPPLRERREDIPLLVASFVAQSRASTGKNVQDVSHEAMRLLMAHPWPGNVRELKSAIEFAAIQCKGSVIQRSDLPPEISGSSSMESLDESPAGLDERARVLAVLKRVGGKRAAAAALLGISRASLYRKLAKLEIPLRS